MTELSLSLKKTPWRFNTKHKWERTKCGSLITFALDRSSLWRSSNSSLVTAFSGFLKRCQDSAILLIQHHLRESDHIRIFTRALAEIHFGRQELARLSIKLHCLHLKRFYFEHYYMEFMRFWQPQNIYIYILIFVSIILIQDHCLSPLPSPPPRITTQPNPTHIRLFLPWRYSFSILCLFLFVVPPGIRFSVLNRLSLFPPSSQATALNGPSIHITTH